MSDQTITPPDLDDVLSELKNSIFSTMNCIQIGKIEKVNSNQTVEIQIQFKRRISGNLTAAYPVLVDCPYIVLQGSGSYIDMPIEKGDYCLIFFNDRNIDNWWNTENVSEPLDRRKHNISDGIALIGLNPSTKILNNNGDAIGIIAGTKLVRIKNDTETLKTLIDDLINAIVAIVTVGSATTQVLNPASQAALNAIKVRMALLLKD